MFTLYSARPDGALTPSVCSVLTDNKKALFCNADNCTISSRSLSVRDKSKAPSEVKWLIGKFTKSLIRTVFKDAIYL